MEKLESTLIEVLSFPCGVSSAGYPFFEQEAWEKFRDRVPHLFQAGARVLDILERLKPEADENRTKAIKVAEQIVKTACITAPTDLWLMRHVLRTFNELGLYQRLLDGEAIYPAETWVEGVRLNPSELETDLHFLLARGVVEQYDESFRIAGHERVREYQRIVERHPAALTRIWARALRAETMSPSEVDLLASLGQNLEESKQTVQNHWIPTLEEIEIGYRLVPLVLAMRASMDLSGFGRGAHLGTLCAGDPRIAQSAQRILECAGWLDGETVTALGARGFARAPGPFGIIETYNGYMERSADILLNRCESVWVERSANVGASQDANAGTFKKANDALDKFRADTGFDFRVFVEHAIGRGEATRQRFQRDGDRLQYVGADLEDAAIDAAIVEQQAGRLPANMFFVRHADIGKPEVLIAEMQAAGVATYGAVMMVGNGFHEVRNQSDETMVEVFKGYARAGFILLFTEENALSVDDLRATAYNTYHAGFKYVHEKSGQGLRPSEPRPKPRLGKPLRAPWSLCAKQAGYTRLDAYCTRTRTIYPHKPASGHNPSISVNHFFVPDLILAEIEK